MRIKQIAKILAFAVLVYGCSTEAPPTVSQIEPESPAVQTPGLHISNIGGGQSACPPGWELDPKTGSCYNFHTRIDCPEGFHPVWELKPYSFTCCPAGITDPSDPSCGNPAHRTPRPRGH